MTIFPYIKLIYLLNWLNQSIIIIIDKVTLKGYSCMPYTTPNNLDDAISLVREIAFNASVQGKRGVTEDTPPKFTDAEKELLEVLYKDVFETKVYTSVIKVLSNPFSLGPAVLNAHFRLLAIINEAVTNGDANELFKRDKPAIRETKVNKVQEAVATATGCVFQLQRNIAAAQQGMRESTAEILISDEVKNTLRGLIERANTQHIDSIVLSGKDDDTPKLGQK